ncbi:MAG: hypothetical protein ACEQSR_12875 [Candidatus Methylacidiphilales bacterium]
METPKEKAIEIYNKMRGEKTEAKEAALLVVTEIVKGAIPIAPLRFEYWQEVKKEIEKI